jgi:hypothetical protein
MRLRETRGRHRTADRGSQALGANGWFYEFGGTRPRKIDRHTHVVVASDRDHREANMPSANLGDEPMQAAVGEIHGSDDAAARPRLDRSEELLRPREIQYVEIVGAERVRNHVSLGCRRGDDIDGSAQISLDIRRPGTSKGLSRQDVRHANRVGLS